MNKVTLLFRQICYAKLCIYKPVYTISGTATVCYDRPQLRNLLTTTSKTKTCASNTPHTQVYSGQGSDVVCNGIGAWKFQIMPELKLAENKDTWITITSPLVSKVLEFFNSSKVDKIDTLRNGHQTWRYSQRAQVTRAELGWPVIHPKSRVGHTGQISSLVWYY